jgi:fluoroacetyl-CoA thioesterase
MSSGPSPRALEPGLKHVETIRVAEAHTVPAMTHLFASFDDMPPVFATAYLVAFVEWTCTEALKPYLAPGQRSVGTHVNLSHVAATPIGIDVTAEVELVEVEGRRLKFKATCRDAAEVIGEGFHERFVIDAEKFAARMAKKTAISRIS